MSVRVLRCVSAFLALLSHTQADDIVRCRTSDDCQGTFSLCIHGDCVSLLTRRWVARNNLDIVDAILYGSDLFSTIPFGKQCRRQEDCLGTVYGLTPSISDTLKKDIALLSHPLICEEESTLCTCAMEDVWNGYFCSALKGSFRYPCTSNSDCNEDFNLHCNTDIMRCTCKELYRFNGLACKKIPVTSDKKLNTLTYTVMGEGQMWCHSDQDCPDMSLCNSANNSCFCPHKAWKGASKCRLPSNVFTAQEYSNYPFTIPMITFILVFSVFIPICCRFTLNFVRNNILSSQEPTRMAEWLSESTPSMEGASPSVSVVPRTELGPPPVYEQFAPPNYDEALKTQLNTIFPLQTPRRINM